MLKKLSMILWIVQFFFVCAAAYATPDQDTPARKCVLSALQIDERPGPTDHPTIVTIGLRLLDVTGIEDTSQSITVDAVVSLTWMDPRLSAFEGCQFGLDQIRIHSACLSIAAGIGNDQPFVVNSKTDHGPAH